MKPKSFQTSTPLRSWTEVGHRFVVHQIYANREIKYRIYIESGRGYVSWLLARPPSLNPLDGVAAVRDRRFSPEFIEFEGPIDKVRENGLVLIWDRGSCQIEKKVQRKESMSALTQGLKAGVMTIDLMGAKLKGSFELTRSKSKAERWSLRKERDRFAAKTHFYFDEQSVVSDTILKEWLDFGLAPLAPTWRELRKPMTIKLGKLTSSGRVMSPLALGLTERRKLFQNLIGKLDLGFRCSQLSKSYFSDSQIQKIDVLAYYYFIAPYMLPHMQDLPVVSYRYPFGIGKKPIVERSIRGEAPTWLRTVALFEQGHVRSESHVIADSERCLLFLANRSCLELATWLSALGALERPRQVVIGLQSVVSAGQQLIAVALGIRTVLTELGVQSFCKATGVSGGLQLVIPLSGEDDFRDVHIFLRSLVEIFTQRLSGQITLSRSQSGSSKVWLHFPGMSPGRAVIAPYSLRANVKATVACPLAWDELESGVNLTSVTIGNIFQRLQAHGDPWRAMEHASRPKLKELINRMNQDNVA